MWYLNCTCLSSYFWRSHFVIKDSPLLGSVSYAQFGECGASVQSAKNVSGIPPLLCCWMSFGYEWDGGYGYGVYSYGVG